MLNAIVVRPPNAPNAASIKKHAERTHPPGGLFYQFAADGHYTSVRAAAGRQDGTWTIVAGKLSLTGAEKGAKPVICPLENLSADRLTFKLPMPAGAPDVVLDFAPGRMPQQ